MKGSLSPAISIVIPTLNRVEQTRQTLIFLYQSHGWNSQFFPEVILADSTPGQEIKNLTKEFQNPRPDYVRSQNRGIAASKNVGAKRAKNEILFFCDSDIEVESEALGETINYLKRAQTVAMVGGQVIWKGGEKEGQLDRPRPEDRQRKIEDIVYAEVIYSRFLATYKSLFWQVGGYDEELFNMRGEGSDLSLRFWRCGLPLAYDKKVRVHHVYQAPGAVTRHLPHFERGIIRDLIQLGYKYGLSRQESPNFAKTLRWLTKEFGENDKYILVESFVALLSYFWENRGKLEKSRRQRLGYDFKFLDVFTKEKLFLDCLKNARPKIEAARRLAFNGKKT